MLKRSKISIIGGGNVGASCALWTAAQELADVVVLDIPEVLDKVRGRMLDLAQCSPLIRSDARIRATDDYQEIEASDIVVITAGLPRKPGMSRDDLIAANVQIVRNVCEKIAKHAPDSIVIVVSNPLDAMVYTAWKVTGFPTERIVGQAGCLDVARFKTFIAIETGFSVEDINALLLGGHGDDMVPLPRFTNISGIPISQFLSDQQLDQIIERTKNGGGEIIKLMGTSAYYAPGGGVVDMVESVLKDKKRILPCASYCDGQFGIRGLFVGVPTLLGAAGVERIIEVKLNEQELALLRTSADHVAELVERVQQSFPELA